MLNPVTHRSSVICALVFVSLVTLHPLDRALLAQDVLIRGGWLFNAVADDVTPNPGILVRAGKFVAIGESVSRYDPSAVEIVQLGDSNYILPGMFDLHAHYAIDLFGQGRVDDTQSYPAIFLANGVTSTFPAGAVDPDSLEALSRRVDRGEQAGARLFHSGPYFGRAREGWDDAMSAEDIYREVDEWAARGVRHFKAKRPSPEHLRALIERAHLHGATVTGHLDSRYRDNVNPADGIRMGIDRVEHFLGGEDLTDDKSAYASLEYLDLESPHLDSIIRLYIDHNVYFDATLTAYGYYGERDPEVYTYFDDERTYFTPYVQQLLAERTPRQANDQFERVYWVKRHTIKAFYDAGGADLITLGTDHPTWGEYVSGFAVHRELHAFVLAGIPPADALKIATINGARALNVSSYLGTIEVGKFADLVVVEGNPLVDIRNTRNTRVVMKAGIVYDPRDLLESVRGTIGPNGPDEVELWTSARRQ
jgi:imidazolonepropionase-like amidohydrolase